MYNCEGCGIAVGPGVPCSKHIIYRHWHDAAGRSRKDVVREVKCCSECKDDLDAGIPLRMIQEELIHATRGHEIATSQHRASASVPVRQVKPINVLEWGRKTHSNGK